MADSDLFGLAAATTVAVVLNVVFERLFSSKPLHGYPRWRWLLSVTIQCTALIFCLIMAVLTNGPLGIGWLTMPWEAYEVPFWGKWYIYVLFGSQARDLNQFENKLLFAHHVVVILTCLATLALPAGPGMYLYCSGVLEIGSIFYNFRVLYPTTYLFPALYCAIMPLTNMAALAVGTLLVSIPEGVSVWVRAFFAISLLAVCIGREREHLIYMGLWSKRGPTH